MSGTRSVVACCSRFSVVPVGKGALGEERTGGEAPAGAFWTCRPAGRMPLAVGYSHPQRRADADHAPLSLAV